MPGHRVIHLPEEDEWPHTPGPETLWQESVVLAFQDISRRVGGFIRIGHQPNCGEGRLTFGLVSPGNCYARSKEGVSMRTDDRSAYGFALDGFVSATFTAAGSHWQAADADCTLDLTVTNLHPLFDVRALAREDEWHKEFNAHHTEVAGRVRGSLRIGEERYEVDGYGFRDHSWGVRNLANPQALPTNFFWLIGSFGEDFVYSIAEVITRAGGRVPLGFIIRDGVYEVPSVQDCAFEMNLDGVTMRRMRAEVSTPRLGTFSLQAEGFGNVLLSLGEHYLESGMPATVTSGDRVGGGHVSAMFNARAGTAFPPRLFGTSPHNGLHRAKAFREEWPQPMARST